MSPYSAEVIKKEMSPQDYSKMVEKGKKKAYYAPKTDDPFWKPPEHAADVKREYLFESPRQRGRWLRTKVKERFPNEEKYRKFDLVLGLVHRRIAKNRVEILVKDAEYSHITHGFMHESALIVVKDDGQTRVGDYVSANLVNKNSEISTHKLREIIRTSGQIKCPITGMLIRENQLVDPEEEGGEEIFSRKYINDMHDKYLDRRVYNYKYRDDFNRDHVTYERRWNASDLERASKEASSPQRKLKFQERASKRSKKIEMLKKELAKDISLKDETEI